MNRIRSNWRSWTLTGVLIVVLYAAFKGLNALMAVWFDWRDAGYRTDIGTAFSLGMVTAMFALPLLRRPVDALYRRFAPAPAKN